MVKADVSRDYYAELEVPPTASEEEIKKAFRTLAKVYHPDRNPGKEVDVVPKFQAVQAAHEILSDPEQKRKYDLERTKLKANTPIIPRRGPVPPTPSQFPPPPRRAGANATRQNPFTGNANTPRARQPPTSANPEKYAPYARAGAQQWEKTKEEAQSKADALRGFQHMKPGQSPTGERFAPPPPPRQSHYPTAPRPMSYVPRSAGPPPRPPLRPQRSWDDLNNAGPFTAGSGPSAGFPGLSRTQSTRKTQGFTPATPRGDEPPAPRSSYATYSHAERPSASTPQSYFPENSTHPSPQLTPQRPGRSPLRHARSASGVEQDRHPQRPGLERIPSRYSGIGGERTDVSSAGLGRSSSVRNSPVDPRFHEHDRNGVHQGFPYDVPKRHLSSSPKSRPKSAQIDSSSDSETSSEEAVEEQRWAAWPKATPRPKFASPDLGRRPSADGQAATGPFPGTNYVKPLAPRETDSGRYPYRPPPPPRNQHASQAAFNYVPGYSETRPAGQQPTPGVGNGYAGPEAPVNGPNISSSDTDAAKPRKLPKFQSASHEDVSQKFSASEWNSKLAGAEDLFRPTPSDTPAKKSPVRAARSRAKSYSRTQASPIRESSNELPTGVNGGPKDTSTTSEAFAPGKFAAEEWLEKLRYQTTAGPNEDARMKSPVRGFKVPVPKPDSTDPKPGSLSEEKGARSASAEDPAGSGHKLSDDVDPMDIDDSFPSSIPSTPCEVYETAEPPQPVPEEKGLDLPADTSGLHPPHTGAPGLKLNDLSNIAPLRPSNTGLGDLQDLNTTLPFESEASPTRPSQSMANGFAFSSLKALNLPKPPKHVLAPLENVTQEAWTRYTKEMSAYMHDWHIFNKKMLDHFQARQAQLDMTLMFNWMSALGDGPSGDEISRKVQENPSASGSAKAGYAAYRQWSEEDMRVREWWNVACEKHRQAVIELGRVREMAKPLAVT